MLRMLFKINVLVMILLSFQLLSFGQTAENDLLNRIVDLDTADNSLPYILGKIAQTYKVPIGLEKSSDEKDERKLTIKTKGKPLKEVLNLIIQQEPTYKWELKDGVINFRPVKDRFSFIEKLLDTEVNNFVPERGLTTSEMRDSILELAEVSNLLILHRVKLITLDYPGLRFYPKELDLSVSNTNVRGILNNLVKNSEYNMWIVDMYGNNKEKLIISF